MHNIFTTLLTPGTEKTGRCFTNAVCEVMVGIIEIQRTRKKDSEREHTESTACQHFLPTTRG